MRAPEVIAPRVLGYDIDPQNAIGSPFILQSRIRGCDLLHCSINRNLWQNFSFYKFSPGLARALVDLFSIEIPNVIGSVMGVSEEGIPTVGPFEEEAVFRGSDRPFQSAMEYIEWRISASIWEDKEEASVDVPALLQRLEILAERIITRLDSSLLRACLVHVDPHDRTVMVEESKFNGLVDLQALALPAFMAAEYPPYLRYDGMYEDRYAALNQYGKIEFMNKDLRPSRDDTKILRDLYLECCRKRNPIYARALVEGQVLRQLVEWLTFVEWEGDFVWPGLELWEVDQREKLDASEWKLLSESTFILDRDSEFFLHIPLPATK
ncbi:hypothetical protein M413DRAFT_257735 [Hebeloma cylindrosporum]|uniref:Aminoglycoside phosphotransferase domain-containing protein n=1 Tax=Hebeloma cylindrosporum TaxID=76867 RepID=A0A0C2Y962_HEBCY|nr:hypothetical protein M413DRAFT_257735 [Hebeloma cylindrosporum h7]